jgi:hypothetical protein
MKAGFLCLVVIVFLAACGEGEIDNATAENGTSYADIVANSDHFDGYFDVYRDKLSGELYLGIDPDQLDEEFIYAAFTENGAVEAGHFVGAFLENTVVTLRRHFKRIEFVKQNTNFYFDADSPLARASDANISPAVLAAQEIVAEDEASGRLLVKADNLFMSENLNPIKPVPDPEQDPNTVFSLGSLSESRTKVFDVRAYPDNTDVFVEYVFENPAPVVEAAEDVTDSRFVSIRLQHSFVKMPVDDFTPRYDDPRVGYFFDRVTDLTDYSHTPFRDLIRRWKLVKKDPDADVSDPVEPIVWWIENTTPLEFRDTIRDAALAWNQSFETAGFSNAIEVREQPDDAEWNAGDIRYNVLRWTSSPQPPFGGYGPHFANPRTGQIVGADIMLEYSFVRRHLRALKLLETLQSGGVPKAPGNLYCSLGHGLQLSNLFAEQALKATGGDPALEKQIVHDTLRYLILHEIGHTLGLNHNMRATQFLSLDQAFDHSAVEEKGLAGSVMDYPAINFAPPGRVQTLFYAVQPGPYDDWAIEFGYAPELDDPAAREAHLGRSTEPYLVFGNDADDMRSPGKAVDPRVNIYDMTNDAVGYAVERFALIDNVLTDMRNRFGAEGESFQELHDAYLGLATEFQRSANTVSRYIGGVMVNRAMVGQAGATTPFIPVSFEDQERAMTALRDHVFAPDAFRAPDDLYNHLRQQRRGFDFYETTEDPKIHDVMLAVQSGILDHLMHPVVQKRITDSRLYGNEYDLAAVMNDLTSAIFSGDLRGNVNTFRQNLQLDYVNRLLGMVSGETKAGYDNIAQSTALYNLRRIEGMIDGSRGSNEETRAHRENVLYTIRRGLHDKPDAVTSSGK